MKWYEVLFWVIMIAASLLLTRWIFNAVMAADIPDWLKYFILH